MTTRSRWSGWHPLDRDTIRDNDEAGYGVYAIRIAQDNGEAIPVPRIGGKDPEGIIYIGKSGNLRGRKTDRTLGQRLEEHIGGRTTAAKAFNANVRQLRRRFGALRLACRVKQFSDTRRVTSAQVAALEELEIRKYVGTFCEMPPYNSVRPGKWE